MSRSEAAWRLRLARHQFRMNVERVRLRVRVMAAFGRPKETPFSVEDYWRMKPLIDRAWAEWYGRWPGDTSARFDTLITDETAAARAVAWNLADSIGVGDGNNR